MGMFRLKGERTMFQRAFLQTADLLLDMSITRPSEAVFRAGYIANPMGDDIPIVFDLSLIHI